MHKRSLLLASAPILAVILVAVLLYAVQSSSQPPPSTSDDTIAALATAIPTKPIVVSPATPAPDPATSFIPSTPAQAADTDIIALVNGETLRVEDLALAQAVDKAMSALLGAQPATAAQLVEQRINHTLVTQQIAAGGPVSAVDAPAQLAALLSSVGKTQTDLTAALAAAGVERAAFDQYFSDLLTVQEFVRAAAATQGRPVDAYISGLQTVARISYGPAATLALQAAPTAPAGAVAAATAAPAGAALGMKPLTELFAPAPEAQASASTSEAQPAAAPALTETQTAAPDAEARGLEVGRLAPDFALVSLADATGGDAERQTTFDELLGQPTVLSFWTTWCPYCLRQTPVLVAAAGQYTEGIRFVGVDVGESAATVTPYVEQHAIPYTILLDQNSQIAAAYGVEGFPTTYFLDATGRIVARQIGSLSEEQLQQYVEQLLLSRS